MSDPESASTPADENRIYFAIGGGGPDLLLIHGTGTRRNLWLPVRAALETHFTVLAMDRRGYGHSGDASPYAIEREYEDIARCIDARGSEPVDVVAHSFGALCALGAAKMGARINRLILYEPPIPTVSYPYCSPGLILAMRQAVARGDPSDAVARFLTDVIGLRPEVIAAMRRLTIWAEQTSMISLTIRELAEVDRFRLRTEDYAGWRIPTLLLLGGSSAPQYRATANALRTCLAGSVVEVLPGQQHSAIAAAPKLFAAAVLRFLRTPAIN